MLVDSEVDSLLVEASCPIMCSKFELPFLRQYLNYSIDRRLKLYRLFRLYSSFNQLPVKDSQ